MRVATGIQSRHARLRALPPRDDRRRRRYRICPGGASDIGGDDHDRRRRAGRRGRPYPVVCGRHTRLQRASRETEGQAADRAGRARDLRGARAYPRRLPAAGEARRARGRARSVRPPGGRVEDRRHEGDHGEGGLEGRGRAGAGRSRRDCRVSASPVSAGAVGSSGSTPRTPPPVLATSD